MSGYLGQLWAPLSQAVGLAQGARPAGAAGERLRSRMDRGRATEVDVAVHALDRMLEFGRPISVLIA